MDTGVVLGMSGGNTQKSAFGCMVEIASSKSLPTRRPDEDSEPNAGSHQVCFGMLGYSGNPNDSVELTNRKRHCNKYSDNFFIAFEEPEMFLGIEPGSRVELELDAFPKTCFCKDTLNIGAYERGLRGEHTPDALYASAMEAIALGDDTEQQGKLFRLTKRLFRVDTRVHLRASQQVLLARAGPPSALAMRFSNLVVSMENDGSSFEGHIVCVVEVQTTAAVGSAATSRKPSVRDIDRRLYLAVKALAPTDPLGEIQALLDDGARPARSGSKKGFTAADVAAHLGYPELLALFDALPATAADDEADGTPDSAAAGVSETMTTAITGLSETIPVAVGTEGTVMCPDKLLLPVMAPQESVVKLELWNIRHATAAAAPDGSGGVKRVFLRAAQAPGAATLFEGERESMGSVSVPLAEILPGECVDLSLTPEGVSASASAPCVTAVNFKLGIPDDPAAICAERRKLHRSLVRKVHTAASPAEPCDGDLRAAYDGGKTAAFRPLFDLHARCCKMSAVEQAIDELCVIVELHAEIGVAPSLLESALSRVVQLKEGAKSTWHSLVTNVDSGRFIGCVEAIVTTCVHLAARPVQYIGRDDAGLKQLQSCITVLMLAFSIGEWRAATAGEDDDNEYDDIPVELEEATVYETEVIKAAREVLTAQKSVNYMKLKSTLLTKFGEAEFGTYKSEIQKMCVEYDSKKTETEQHYVPDRSSPLKPGKRLSREDLLARVQQIMVEERPNIFMYSRIRLKLVHEFDVVLLENCREAVGAIVIDEMGLRLATADAGEFDTITASLRSNRVLSVELLYAMKNFTHEVYARIRQKAAPTRPGPFSDFSEMITVVNSVVQQLKGLLGSFAAEFGNVEGLSVVTAFTNWLDFLVARDVKTVLNQWASRASETGFPVAFFELFSATRAIWHFIEANVPESTYHRYHLIDYQDWFLPCVTDWLIQSKAAAMEMVMLSVDRDDWLPVSGARLVSSSCYELFRTIYELTTFFKRIDWPDRTEREERLYVLLCDAVCGVGRLYCEKVVHGINLPADVTEAAAMGTDYYMDNDVCIRLNNLEEVSVKFGELFKFMQVTSVAEAHRIRYSDEDSYKPHRSLDLFQTTNIAIQDHILSVGKKVAYLICLRIERDLEVAFSRFTAKSDPSLVANRSLDGLLVERDDFRVNLSKTGQDRAVLFDNQPLAAAVRIRQMTHQTTGGTAKGGKQDGYLRLNTYLLASKLEYRETMIKMILCIWMRFVFVLGKLLVQLAEPVATPPEAWLELIQAMKTSMMQFLNDNGDGVSMAELNATSDNVLRPVTECYQMETADLISYFYDSAAAQQAGPIRQCCIGGASRAGGTGPDDSFSEEVVDITGTAADAAARLTQPSFAVDVDYARDERIAPLGKLRLRLIRFGDDSQGFSVRVNVVSATKLNVDRGTCHTYVAACMAPDFVCGDSRISFKTATVKDTFKPTFDEGFTVTDCSNGVAIQLRVMRKVDMSFGSLFSSDPVLGSVFLDLSVLSKLEGEAVIDFPLRALRYRGHLGQVQQLLETRAKADKLAKAFVKNSLL